MADEATTGTTESAAVETSDDSNQEHAGNSASADTVAGEESLGDAGKKALDSMKAERNEARKQARALESRLAEIEAKLNGKESEHAAAVEAQRVKDDALAAANERILKAEVRAAAAGKLADPTDALVHIDLSSLEVSEDGAVDTAAVASAISDLINRKPYLAVQDGKRFQGDADAGARKESRAAQLSRTDLAGMSAREITEARAAGRLDDLLGIKS